MAKPKPPARDLIREVKREFARVKRELEPRLVAEAQDYEKPHLANEEMRNIVVAQNVLRPCMEAVFQELLPFSHLTCMELAIRLASYAISVAPMEDQEKLVSLVLQAFPAAHEMRLARGIVIKTDWQTDGQLQPNHPQGPITDPKSNV